jgi:hypothetical protein
MDEERLQRQLHYLRDMTGASLRSTYFRAGWDQTAAEPFALLHSAVLPEEV